jgi:hypothetical protein
MRRTLTATLAVGIMSLATTRDAAAQPSIGDIAAAAALQATPVFALGVVHGAGAAISKLPKTGRITARGGHYSPETGDGTNLFGASFTRPMGARRGFGATVGMSQASCAGCDDVTMIGADVYQRVFDNFANANAPIPLAVNLQGSLGFGTQGDDTHLSAIAAAPVTARLGQRVNVVVTPALGYGQISFTGGSEGGIRFGWLAHGAFRPNDMFSFGLGANQVMIDGGGMNAFGFVSFNLGGVIN